MDAVAAKDALRRRLLAARAPVPDRVASALAARVLALPSMRAARVVAAYVALPGEVPAPLGLLRARGVCVLLPVLLDDGALGWGTEPLTPRRYGLLEPLVADRALAEASVVLVPGVAFDPFGRRLGRGGGSYDRALGSVTSALRVGLVDDAGLVDEVPTGPHDVRVDVVVTPTMTLYP